jgi:hypothetical protein
MTTNRLLLTDVLYVPLQPNKDTSLANAQLTMCHLCSKPVELETAKTDEHGRAVHEECYLRKIRSKTELPDST